MKLSGERETTSTLGYNLPARSKNDVRSRPERIMVPCTVHLRRSAHCTARNSSQPSAVSCQEEPSQREIASKGQIAGVRGQIAEVMRRTQSTQLSGRFELRFPRRRPEHQRIGIGSAPLAIKTLLSRIHQFHLAARRNRELRWLSLSEGSQYFADRFAALPRSKVSPLRTSQPLGECPPDVESCEQIGADWAGCDKCPQLLGSVERRHAYSSGPALSAPSRRVNSLVRPDQPNDDSTRSTLRTVPWLREGVRLDEPGSPRQ